MKRVAISRRTLLVGGGLGIGLTVGFVAWPRIYAPALNVTDGEHALSGFVKVGEDGHVTVVVPQVELGHGVFTGLAQIVADELGADWRTILVETAQPGRDYGNTFFADEWHAALGARWTDQVLAPTAPMVTGWSNSVRNYEVRLRDAGAAARALLCAAAGARWDAAWDACETHDGFVSRGSDRLRFGELAAQAARIKLPAGVTWRDDTENRLSAQALPRLDLPSKVDGSVNYAADIRLPDMVYASISEGPIGTSRVARVDTAAARRVIGVLDVCVQDRWVAVVGTNWWAADRGLDALRAQFDVTGDAVGNHSVDAALNDAFQNGTRMVALGDIEGAFRGETVLTQEYRVGPAPHAPVETAGVTVSIDGGTAQIWMATQVPERVRDVAARALGFSADRVIVHPMMVGGSFGARLESDLVMTAAVLAMHMKRPVQLTRSRAEEMQRDVFRPPAAARMAARIVADGRIAAWYAQIATPATVNETQARAFEGRDGQAALQAARGVVEPGAILGAVPPYDIPVYAVDHHSASVGVPTGDWRGRAAVANTFFAESFFDELAHMSGGEPFSARMAMLGTNPRLAQCLARATATANWQGGGTGSNQGLACAALAGSTIAVVAQARLDGGRIKVERLVAVADVGRVINPDIVRAQIIGGLVFGMASAVGAPVDVHRGMAGPTRYGLLGLPRLADCPPIEVELIVSRDTPGGVGELAVPPVAPALAGALFAATGVRYRHLPLLAPMVVASVSTQDA